MKLALRELVRKPGRFVTATVILTLIAVLLMFLGGLLDGLLRLSTGAIRAQSGDAIVYSESSQSSFLRSRIEPADRAALAQAVSSLSAMVAALGDVIAGLDVNPLLVHGQGVTAVDALVVTGEPVEQT